MQSKPVCVLGAGLMGAVLPPTSPVMVTMSGCMTPIAAELQKLAPLPAVFWMS